MKIFIETDRLILRTLEPTDAAGMFELDSDPEVHQYLGGNPVKSIEQSQADIEFIRKQYQENGIGRWAVIEKSTNEFIGWGGLKLITEPVYNHVNYYDVGYRFIKKFWGKGYASETAKASIEYGFSKLSQSFLYAMADVNNHASIHVLEKSGFKRLAEFDYKGTPSYWFEIQREQRR
jgi:ribosomal-protein-alanine N-acetyltransferase